MLDFYAQKPIVVVSPEGQVIARLGGRGEGPGEFRDVRSLAVRSGAAYVWDFALHRLTRVPVRDLDEELTSRQLQPLESDDPRLILEVEILDSGYLLLLGQMGSDLAYILKDSLASPLGTGVVKIPGRTETIRVSLSQASAIVEEDRGILAIGFVNTGEMLFADVSTGSVLNKTKPGLWPSPVPRPRKAGKATVLSPSPDNFLGYRSVKKSRDGVWGLFIGNTARLKYGPYASRDVHAYDWDGRLRRILRLSIPVSDIAVHGDYLYGTDNQVVPRLVRWRLPSSLLAEMADVADDAEH